MVLSFEKRIFEVLKEKDLTQLKKLMNLIFINFSESIDCEKYAQNFIFLDIDVCEFLMEIENNRYLQKYYDNFVMIASIKEKIKDNIINIVYDSSKDKINEIEYDYGVISEIISKNSKIIIENINDKYIYEPLIKAYNKEGIKIGIDFVSGNGGQLPDFLEATKDKKEINLIITDKDKKFPEDNNNSSTPVTVGKKLKELSLYHKHIIIEFKNIEGLIPIETARQKSSNSFEYFDEYSKENDDWIKYLDFKKGIKKNIYSKKNNKQVTVEDSLRWWILILDDTELESNIKKMPDNEVFKSGLGLSINNLELTEKNFLFNSSKKQKQEYQRIYSLVYPYIIVNDYGLN